MTLDLLVASDGPSSRRLGRHLPAHGIAVHPRPVGPGVETVSPADGGGRPRYDVGFVYPARVVEGDVLTAVHDLTWVNGREDILTTRNKAGSLARLAAAEIPTPRTVHVSSPVDESTVREAYRTFDAPAVLKPNATTRGTGHVLVHDVDSLRGVVDYLDLVHSFPATRDRSFLLQEYVPSARDLRLTLIDGSVAGAVERRFDERDEGMWVRNVHRGATAVAVDPPAAAVELAERAAATLDVPFLGVDLLLTEDRSLVLEVNGRPTIDRVEKYPSGFYRRLAALVARTAETA